MFHVKNVVVQTMKNYYTNKTLIHPPSKQAAVSAQNRQSSGPQQLVFSPPVQRIKGNIRQDVGVGKLFRGGDSYDLKEEFQGWEHSEFDHQNALYVNGNPYLHKWTNKSIISAPILMIHIQRNLGEGYRMDNSVIPPQTKQLEDKTVVELKAIFVHQGHYYSTTTTSQGSGHYIVYIKCGANTWYKLNDLAPKATPMGTFQQMIRTDPTILKNSTDYLYLLVVAK